MLMPTDDISAIQYVQQHTAPEDRIYVGAGRHDKLFLSNVRFYFFAERGSVTKWYDLHPGVQTTAPIQNEIVDAMRRHPPKLVILDVSSDDKHEPNHSSESSGVRTLDEYIVSHYAPKITFGKLIVLAPR